MAVMSWAVCEWFFEKDAARERLARPTDPPQRRHEMTGNVGSASLIRLATPNRSAVPSNERP